MARLDPVFMRQFGWTDHVDLSECATNADLARDLLGSYLDDPGYVPPQVATREINIDGPLGAQTLRLRIYEPDPGHSKPRRALMWVHGGSFTGGDLDMLESNGVAREVCDRGDMVGIAVDYHRATDTIRYPTLHREVLTAFEWTAKHTVELGVDPSRISLGGASAGANLVL